MNVMSFFPAATETARNRIPKGMDKAATGTKRRRATSDAALLRNSRRAVGCRPNRPENREEQPSEKKEV